MQYQTFPGVKGGSKSLDKLAALRLPDLHQKRFLDVGCNEGFFCGYALFEGAKSVTGIDQSQEAIGRAALRFPEGQFLCQSWQTLPEGPFDVITFLSALHYADDQEALIHQIMQQLDPQGVLVLEISIAPGSKDAFVPVKRAIDERLFPTRIKLGSMLKDYAWKVVGHSVKQAGDPLQRYVVHVRKCRPYAYLLMDKPGTGKSTIARRLFEQTDMVTLSGDQCYYRIKQQKITCSPEIQAIVDELYTSSTIDKVTKKIFEQGLHQELVSIWKEQAGFADFALDSFVPESSRADIAQAFFDSGYFPVELQWPQAHTLGVPSRTPERAAAYAKHLAKTSLSEQAKCVRVTRQLPEKWRDRLCFHLDSPVNNQLIVEDNTVRFSGWAGWLDETDRELQLVVSQGTKREVFNFARERKDVLATLFPDQNYPSPYWEQSPCGFSVRYKLDEKSDEPVQLSLQADNHCVPIATVQLTVSRGEQATSDSYQQRAKRWLKRCLTQS
ncbi:methyltransferase domain-containing protein [Salinivibrio kushneri]|nr:methyltransferase domain-containing protein [Salinivibrio kushneri]